MGYPEYVVALSSEKHRQAAIQVCEGTEKGAFEVKKQGSAYKINHTGACEAFARVAGIQFEGCKFHRANGEYYPDEKCGIFSL